MKHEDLSNPYIYPVVIWNDLMLIKSVMSQAELGMKAAQMLIYLSITGKATTKDWLHAEIIDKASEITSKTLNRTLVAKGYASAKNLTGTTNTKIWSITQAGNEIIRKAQKLSQKHKIESDTDVPSVLINNFLRHSQTLTNELDQLKRDNVCLKSENAKLLSKISKFEKPLKKKHSRNNKPVRKERKQDWKSLFNQECLIQNGLRNFPIVPFVNDNHQMIREIMNEHRLVSTAAAALVFIRLNEPVTPSMLSKAGFYRLFKNTDSVISNHLIKRKLIMKIKINDGIHDSQYVLSEEGKEMIGHFQSIKN